MRCFSSGEVVSNGVPPLSHSVSCFCVLLTQVRLCIHWDQFYNLVLFVITLTEWTNHGNNGNSNDHIHCQICPCNICSPRCFTDIRDLILTLIV